MSAVVFAAPSCVIPGTVAENARFLSGRVEEAGLCLFEARSCLEYTVADLPMDLVELPLGWHVHLPVDLPWEAGGAAAAALALAVLGRAMYLSPRRVVLHPPDALHGSLGRRMVLLESFMGLWRKYSALPVLLENVEGCPLTDMAEVLVEQGFGLCLDVGHLLGYGQESLLAMTALMERVQLVHWSAPGLMDQHLPLTALTPEQRATASRVAAALPKDLTHLVEVFHWNGVESSLPVLKELLG